MTIKRREVLFAQDLIMYYRTEKNSHIKMRSDSKDDKEN